MGSCRPIRVARIFILSAVLIAGMLTFAAPSSGGARFEQIASFQLGGEISTFQGDGVIWCPDRTCIIYSLTAGSVFVQDLFTDRPPALLYDYSEGDFTAQWSPELWPNADSTQFVVTPGYKSAGIVEVWGYDETQGSGAFNRQLAYEVNGIDRIFWSPDQTTFALMETYSSVSDIWSLDDHQAPSHYEVDGFAVNFSPASQYLVTLEGYESFVVQIYDSASDYQRVAALKTELWVREIEWYSDNRRLFIQGLDGIEVWDGIAGEKLASLMVEATIENAQWVTETTLVLKIVRQGVGLPRTTEIALWDITNHEAVVLESSTEDYSTFQYIPELDRLFLERHPLLCDDDCVYTLYSRPLISPQSGNECERVSSHRIGWIYPQLGQFFTWSDQHDRATLFNAATCTMTLELMLPEGTTAVHPAPDAELWITSTATTIYIWRRIS